MNDSRVRRRAGALVALAVAATAVMTGTGPIAAQDTKHVSIVDQDMTDEEIAAAIAAEGGLVVGNWTYTANSELEAQFRQYVKDTYGVDILFTYEGSQTPSVYLTRVLAAQAAGNASPIDVLAIEENYWAELAAKDALEAYLPSDLIPNQSLVLDQLQHVPTSIAFQSTAFPAVVFSKERAGWLTKLSDLADPRLQGRITFPVPGDITAGGFMLGLASELSKDYADPVQMKEVVDWFMANIHPNVLKYTGDSAEMQQLLQSGVVDAVTFWNSLARLEYFSGNTDATLLLPAEIFAANGFLFIPKGVAHPVLSQVFVNWRLSPEVQFPNEWPIDHGPWAELSEGFLGPDYQTLVPDWFEADYANYYPSLEQIESQFKPIDWDAYNASAAEWQPYFLEQLGL